MRNSICLVIILAFVAGHKAIAQPKIEFNGRVTDTSGAPLIGASVIEKYSRSGTIADYNGSFRIATSPNGVLLISAIGYQSKEINISSSTSLDITLLLDTRPMSDVVVTGTGVATSKRRLGISIESINATDLPATPGNSIDQALVGKIPGALIASISGNPGDPVNILLRGINTVQNGTQPLILLDGISIPVNDLNVIDFNTIARVEVAQGAASASIYGAQGANGVIQLFTQKGMKGKPLIQVSSNFSANQFINSGDVHQADLHPYLTDASNNIIDVNTGLPLTYNAVGTIEGLSYTYGGPTRLAILDTQNVFNKPYNANLKYYDHFKQVFQTGTTSSTSISISGASDKNDYYLSLSNMHNLSAFMKNGYVNRVNLTANIGMELFKGFKLRSITQLIYTKNTLIQDLGAESELGLLGSTGGMSGFMFTSPFFDLKRKLADNTYPIYLLAAPASRNSANPFYNTEYSSSISNRVNIIQTIDAGYRVNKFLELDANVGIDYQNKNVRFTYFNQSQNLNSAYYTKFIPGFAPDNTGNAGILQYNITNLSFLGSAIFQYNIEKYLHVESPVHTNTQVSFDYRNNNFKELGTGGFGLPLTPPYNLTATSIQFIFMDQVIPFITYGWLVNEKIDIGDLGGITAGFRTDWSSAFGEGSKPFTFPHFDIYLLVPGFFKNGSMSNLFPLLKLRAAYGEAGIQPGPFDRYVTLNQSNLGHSLVYSIPPTTSNPDLQVEVSKEFETGIDFTINSNKNAIWFSSVNGSFTYWSRKCSNVIYPVSVPPSYGTSALLTNAIDLSSNGIQFSLNLPVYTSRNLKWLFTTNFGHQTTIIESISGNQNIILNSYGSNTAIILTAGKKIGQIYGYKALTSLDFTRQDGTPYIPKADADQYTMVDGRVVSKATKQIQFTDETYPLGDPSPLFNASFINTFSFRDIVIFSFQFDWIYGNHLYNQTKEFIYSDGLSSDFTKPVTINGQTGAYSAYWSSPYYNLFGKTTGGNDRTKDFFYEDASFLRLRNISIAFDLTKICHIRTLKLIQLVLSGRNILTVTRYTGLDPEISSGTVNSSYDRGVDNFTLPNIKSYQVGLNITI